MCHIHRVHTQEFLQYFSFFKVSGRVKFIYEVSTLQKAHCPSAIEMYHR